MSTSSFPTILGTWRKSADLDLEAQSQSKSEVRTISGTHTRLSVPSVLPLPSAPVPAHTEPTTDPIDDFFGVTRTLSRTRCGTHDSRHDDRVCSYSNSYISESEVPPPYPHADLPTYSEVGQKQKSEPITLAMYLFKFGFLFPPFWLLGAFILFSPLRAPADFAPHLPITQEKEREALIQDVRRAEVKWAKRCLWALLALAGVVVVIAVAVWGAEKAR